jgi:biopolymer transport protein ExbD
MSLRRASLTKLFSNIDSKAFASILIVLTLTLLFAIWTSPTHHGYGPSLPKALHPVAMPGANREDAMLIAIMRNGDVFFGLEKVAPIDLAAKIENRLRDPNIERKVYIRADGRVWYRTVKQVLQDIRCAGIIRVGFLVDQRRSRVTGP